MCRAARVSLCQEVRTRAYSSDLNTEDAICNHIEGIQTSYHWKRTTTGHPLQSMSRTPLHRPHCALQI
jgi:hypothetical protein